MADRHGGMVEVLPGVVHADPLHDRARGRVRERRVGNHFGQAQLLEADAQRCLRAFGGVSVSVTGGCVERAEPQKGSERSVA